MSTMDLILWRHAEAQLLRPGLDDAQRRLTAKGERQAKRMADWLEGRLVPSTRILVSPAQRTQQTAKALRREFSTVASLAPGQSADELLEAAGWPGAQESVLVVGHQPTLGVVASRLLSGIDALWSVKKGALWWLRRRERDGTVQVTLQLVLGPDFL